jgi:hypothetical protein
MKRLALFAAGLCLLALPSAALADATGTYQLTSPTSNAAPARHASWQLGGPLLSAQEEAHATGAPVSGDFAATDNRYVTARLLTAGADAQTTPCGNSGQSSTITVGGVETEASVFEANLVLNQLRGTGIARVAVAPSPLTNGVGAYFLPGRTRQTVRSNCPGDPAERSGLLPVIGDYGIGLFTSGEGDALLTQTWPLLRQRSGVWALDGVRTRVGTTATAHLRFGGTGQSLHARCVITSVRDLASARTRPEAQRILASAGFAHSIPVAKHSRVVRAGRYFVAKAPGGPKSAPCGSRTLHLARSLGRA